MAVTIKNAASWYVTPCGSSKNGRFAGTYRLHHEGENNVHSSLVLSVLVREEIRSSEKSVLTRVTLRRIPEDGILERSYSCPILEINNLLT
jgi:hypothetical protein